jgi:hypothetical protein
MINLDVLGLVKGLVSGAIRERREYDARKEVKQAMDEYCAAQPDGGAAVAVCMTVAPEAQRR